MTEPLWTDSEWNFDLLKRTYDAVEEIGVNEMGYKIYPNQFEVISAEQMLDAYCSVGMPINYSHWSFGKRFIQEQADYKSGRGGLAYELVINTSPCINYLMEDNTMTTQALVMAHAAIGHNSFFATNYLSKTWTDAEAIVDYMIFAKDYIAKTEMKVGQKAVETFLDSCHALQAYGVNRYRHPKKLSMIKEREQQENREAYLQSQVSQFYNILPKSKKKPTSKFPAQPEENILYFCEKYAPSLQSWQRELLRISRKIAQYFYPQTMTQIINEGFASWTHYTIMNRMHEKGLTTTGSHLEFLQLHSGVIWQPDFDSRYYSKLNPYKLGFEMLREIERICDNPTNEDRDWFPQLIGQNALEIIKDAAENYRDESFIRQYLSPNLIRSMKLFHLKDDKSDTDHYHVHSIHNDNGYQDVRETLANQQERELAIPSIEVESMDRSNFDLHLKYKKYLNRELKIDPVMMRHLKNVWGHSVILHDEEGTVLSSV